MNNSKSYSKEDAVECFLIPFGDNIDPNLENRAGDVNQLISALSQSYIWHRDQFFVYKNIYTDPQSDALPHLHSITYFGDNIDDEWFIVYLIQEITKAFPNMIARVIDNDGEFLLIEAANDLPDWANPVTCENRVYILNGKLHLIGPEFCSIDSELTLTNAIKILQSNTENTEASDQIQKHICKRIGDYPDKIRYQLHKKRTFLPPTVAALLQLKPSLISSAVNAFCNKDSVDLKSCRNLTHFPLENCVMTSTIFTRCLYAMLSHSKYYHLHKKKSSWKMPPFNSTNYNAYALGVKLTCGFEILFSQASNEPLQTNKKWQQYYESLKSKSYFNGNLEGSKDYESLLNKAKQYFSSTELYNTSSYIGNQIKEMMRLPEFETALLNVKNNMEVLEDESDEWLKIKREDLDQMLDNYGPATATCKESDLTPKDISSKISDFMDKSSDLDGIEFPNPNEENAEFNEDKINFEPDQFSACVQNILSLVIPDDDWNLDSGTDLSDYGSDNDFMECDSGKLKSDYKSYANEMEDELSSSTLSHSFVKVKDSKDVDIITNLYSNLKQSCYEEKASAGPTSNILSSLGIPKAVMETLDSDDDEITMAD